jgi:hypothetical protein
MRKGTECPSRNEVPGLNRPIGRFLRCRGQIVSPGRVGRRAAHFLSFLRRRIPAFTAVSPYFLQFSILFSAIVRFTPMIVSRTRMVTSGIRSLGS